MTSKRPFGGRPKRDPLPGERVPLSFRVTPTLKGRLGRAAEKSGRSISLEMELRLEQSFRDDRVLEAIGELARKVGA